MKSLSSSSHHEAWKRTTTKKLIEAVWPGIGLKALWERLISAFLITGMVASWCALYTLVTMFSWTNHSKRLTKTPRPNMVYGRDQGRSGCSPSGGACQEMRGGGGGRGSKAIVGQEGWRYYTRRRSPRQMAHRRRKWAKRLDNGTGFHTSQLGGLPDLLMGLLPSI